MPAYLHMYANSGLETAIQLCQHMQSPGALGLSKLKEPFYPFQGLCLSTKINPYFFRVALRTGMIVVTVVVHSS